MGKTSFSAVIALALLAAACGGDPEHPANLSFDGGSGSGGGSGASGGGGSGGTACQPDPNEGVKLTGDVIIFDILFASEYPGFAGQADIVAEGAPCGWSTTTFDGAAPPTDGGKNRFLLEGVRSTEFTWVRFYEQATSFEPVYATMMPVATKQDLQLDGAFGFMRSTDVQKVYQDTGTTPEPDKATIVLQALDPFTGKPFAGAKMATSVSSVAAYPFGGGWEIGNTATVTDPSGVVVFMNVDALPFPGSGTKINVTAGGAVDSHDLVVEAGVVTISAIGIGFSG